MSKLKQYNGKEWVNVAVDGMSAYELWLMEGNEGTKEDFFESLRGPEGLPGKDADEANITVTITENVTKVVKEEANKEYETLRKHVSSKTYAMSDLSDTKSATTGQIMVKQADGTWAPGSAGSGSGDMTAAVYDPANGARQVAFNDELHSAVTVSDSAEIDLTLTGQQISASIVAGSIDETKLDASVNASLDLADSASQPGHTHTVSNITDITASATELNVLDGIPATLTATELGYVDGVTSAIQTQLNGKLATADIDDTPVNGETSAPISSNWAFDHAATSASDSAAGHVELAIASEVNTGTDATRAVTPDALAGSNTGTRVLSILLNDSTALTTGDGKAYVRVPNECNGMDLVGVRASRVAGTGTPLIQIHNVTQAADMLTTRVSIDSGETDSKDAATAAVIDTGNDDVATGDRLRIDVDDAGTDSTWVEIQLAFRLG